MADLIDRQAAIAALGKYPGFKVRLFGKSYDEGRSDQWFRDVCELTTLPSAQFEQQSFSYGRENDLIDRQTAINALIRISGFANKMELIERVEKSVAYCEGREGGILDCIGEIEDLPAIIPEPSQVARDIATIIENEKDMRAIAEQRIKCAHCKRYDRHNHRCKWWNHGVSNVDWCSYAERITDE